MKKIYIIALAGLMALASACKKDKLATIAANVTAPELKSPSDASAITVDAADSTKLLTFTWSKADYGVQAVVKYFIQVGAEGSNFTTKTTIAAPSDTLSLTYGTFNNILLSGLSLPANQASTVEVRAGSSIYGKDTVYSKPIKITVTTYKELAPAKLYVAGGYQGWNPGAAPNLYPVSTFVFDGYVYIGSASEFKFTTAPDFNHINYGDGGAGKLGFTEPGPSLYVGTGGYYKMHADLKELTYAITLINSFGAIGSATPGSWDNSTPMTYNASTGKWSVTLNLVPGALKFRANNEWTINYGPADSNSLNGILKFDDPGAINISEAGSYTVTIDMSQTGGAPYAYTVTKN